VFELYITYFTHFLPIHYIQFQDKGNTFCIKNTTYFSLYKSLSSITIMGETLLYLKEAFIEADSSIDFTLY